MNGGNGEDIGNGAGGTDICREIEKKTDCER